MRRLIPGFLAAVLVACVPETPTGTAITNVTVIDAVNGVRERQTVIVEGDEIKAVQPADAELTVAETIDGSGKFLIPGLWDFHVHLTYDDRFTASMPALFLSWGVTSVRDTGGLLHKLLPVVARMRAEEAVAPRVFFSGPLLDGEFVVYDGVSRPEIGARHATADNARASITALAAQGVDFIKIYEMVSPQVYEAMIETANELGLPIASHVPLSMRASTAGPRADSMEHLRNVELDCAGNAPELHEMRRAALANPDDLPGAALRASLHSAQRLQAIADHYAARCDEVIDALRATTQVPTLRLNAFSLAMPFERNDWDDALARTPAEVRAEWGAVTERPWSSAPPPGQSFEDWSLELTGRMHARGVVVAAGTDTPIALAIPGYSLHSELEMLVRAGLSPLEALAAATLRPAEWFSLGDELGTIGPGKRADLVLLDENPLEDIANTKSIAAVVSKGRVMSRKDLDALLGEIRP